MSTTKTHIQAKFNQAAANYVTSAIHGLGDDLQWLIEAVDLTGNEQVLDVGTGTGNTAYTFAPHVEHVIGVDISAGMLAQAQQGQRERHLDNIHFERADVEALPYPDAHFDIVVSRYCAHHYEDIAQAVAEIARVLKPNGTFLLVDSYSPEAIRLATYLNTLELLRDTSHVRNYTASEWLRYLDAAQLDADILRTWRLRLDGDNWVQRIKTPPRYVEAIRELLNDADADTRAAIHITDAPNWGFDLPVLLLKAEKR